MRREWEINETDTVFIKRFKQLIQGETLADVARKIKTTRQRVSYWLEGVVPDSTALIALSKAYNVSVDWLCGIDTPRDEIAYQRGFKDGYEKATKTVITALMEVQKMQAIIEGNLYEVEPAVKVIIDKLIKENAELKKENARLEEGYQKSLGVIAATDCVECKKDAEPVKHGRWSEDDEGFYHCSVCKELSDWEHRYCPNCGAKMDGGAE